MGNNYSSKTTANTQLGRQKCYSTGRTYSCQGICISNTILPVEVFDAQRQALDKDWGTLPQPEQTCSQYFPPLFCHTKYTLDTGRNYFRWHNSSLSSTEKSTSILFNYKIFTFFSCPDPWLRETKTGCSMVVLTKAQEGKLSGAITVKSKQNHNQKFTAGL